MQARGPAKPGGFCDGELEPLGELEDELGNRSEWRKVRVSLVDEVGKRLECAGGLATLLSVTLEGEVDGDHERRQRHDRPRLDERERGQRDAEAGLGSG